MADASTSSAFVMHGARAAIANGMLHIEEHVKGIERAVDENPGLAFDLARTLIESACRTILGERGITFDLEDDLPRLFRRVTNNLPFLPAPASAETAVRKSLAQTLNGLHTALQGVCELRNACGFVSHGFEAPRPVLETVQALLAAGTADTIIGFLHRVHCQNRVPSPSPPLDYNDNPDFNKYVDEAHDPVRILNSEFKPSEVLYQMERETYRVAVAEYKAGMLVEEETSSQSGDSGGTQ
jgi:Abortive infection C-terminus